MRYPAVPLFGGIAERNDRNYVTPEDVSELIGRGTAWQDIVAEALAILGDVAGLGVEDRSLFAYASWDAMRRLKAREDA